MGRLTRILVLSAVTLIGSLAGLVLPAPPPALGHDDRKPSELSGQGTVPQYRTTGVSLLVCGTDSVDFTQRVAAFPAALKTADTALWTQCQKSGYHTVQAAVNAVAQPNMIIKILPGVYL